MTLDDYLAVAAEVGLSPGAVEEAAVERRLGRWIGQPALVARGRTTRPPGPVRADVERALGRRHLDRTHHGRSWSLWVQRRGWWPDAARLGRGGRIGVDVSDASPRGTLVTLAAEVRYIRLDHALRLALAGALVAFVVTVLGANLVNVAAATAIVGLAVAALLLGYRTRLRHIEALLLTLLGKVTGADRGTSEVVRLGTGDITWI